MPDIENGPEFLHPVTPIEAAWRSNGSIPSSRFVDDTLSKIFFVRDFRKDLVMSSRSIGGSGEPFRQGKVGWVEQILMCYLVWVHKLGRFHRLGLSIPGAGQLLQSQFYLRYFRRGPSQSELVQSLFVHVIGLWSCPGVSTALENLADARIWIVGDLHAVEDCSHINDGRSNNVAMI